MCFIILGLILLTIEVNIINPNKKSILENVNNLNRNNDIYFKTNTIDLHNLNNYTNNNTNNNTNNKLNILEFINNQNKFSNNNQYNNNGLRATYNRFYLK
tara:strand:- start:38 stop:337 length:300 start_codon:yes stop_codon:yes gene_type:complete